MGMGGWGAEGGVGGGGPVHGVELLLHPLGRQQPQQQGSLAGPGQEGGRATPLWAQGPPTPSSTHCPQDSWLEGSPDSYLDPRSSQRGLRQDEEHGARPCPHCGRELRGRRVSLGQRPRTSRFCTSFGPFAGGCIACFGGLGGWGNPAGGWLHPLPVGAPTSLSPSFVGRGDSAGAGG